MRFCVLGPIAMDPPGDAGLGGARQRRLLAALLLQPGQVVSVDRLAETVFEGEPTDAAAVTLRSYVARLRKSLEGSGAAVVTEAPGYALQLGDGEIDADLFEGAVDEARALREDGRMVEALDTLTAGLELWRGPAFAEFSDEAWIQAEAIRLDELRVDADELRLQCLLDVGRHTEAISDLAAFAERHPLRESTHLMLVTALYRAGRQADALRAASAHRQALAELGLEPTKEFDDLEDRVAIQDPDLRLPPPTGRTLRGYRIGERLGGGDDTEVHTALQPGIERLVVIKTFGSSIADSPIFIREFESRVQEVARIEHPSLLEILDFWREPGSAHLVTRLARGGDLATLLEKGPLAAEVVADLTARIASALADVHARGLFHGHIDPGSVLFDEGGLVLLAGVGTVEIVEAIRKDAPSERAREPGPARDQFGLAALVYRALTGHDPLLDDRRRLPLPRVSEFRPELLAVDGVLARAGAPNPQDRYPDISAFARSFADAIGAEAAVSRPRVVANPYKGLRAFDESDSGEFFGRERLTTSILERMGGERFLALIGASGSGKSSVVRAGVASRLRDPGSSTFRTVVTMVPGAAPFVELTRALGRVVSLERSARLDASDGGVHETLRAAAGGDPLLLVIDQLEELYTLVEDETERARFIDGLMDAVEDESFDLRVLVTLRADFFDRPLQHHRLGAAMSQGAVAIPAMSPSDIERAVVEPAAAAGVTIERAVVAEMVADVVDQPAALPLLQFSLTELFDSRRSDQITLEDHARLGGVGGAIAQRAERLYSDATEQERDLIRILFLRLVAVGGTVADVRRRTDRSELVSAAPDARAMELVIDRFGAGRLLTFDRNPVTRAPTVEVAHEALLRHWPRLGAWIEAAGRDLHLRAHLTGAATGWEASGRDEGELYRGARLATTEEWVDRPDLTDSERAFLAESLAVRAAEAAAEQAKLEDEIRSNRRLRRSLVAVAAVLVVAIAAGFVAVAQRNRAQEETVRADEARGRTLGVIAEDLVAEDRSLALLLAVEASRLDGSDAGRAALLTALGGDDQPFTRTVIPTPAGDYSALALTPDGSVAVGKRSTGLIDLIDLDGREVTVSGLAGPASPVAGLDVSDDGDLMVTSGSAPDGTAAVVYGLNDGTERFRVLARDGSGFSQAVFVPGDHQVLIADSSGTVSVHDGETGAEIRTIDVPGGREIIGLDAWDRTAYVIETDQVGVGPSFLTAFDIDTGDVTAGPVIIEGEFVVRVAASADQIVTSGQTIRVFDPSTLDPIASDIGEARGGGSLTALAVSPFGLITAGSPVDLELWAAVGTDFGPFELPITGEAAGAAFSPDGSTLITADPGGSISTWRLGWIEDLGDPLAPEGPGLVTVSPTGDILAVWARGRGVQLFDRESREHLGALEGLGPEDSFLGLDFSPDGQKIGTLTCPVEQVDTCDASVELFDVGTGRRLAGPTPVGPLGADLGIALEFTADGTRLVSAAGGLGVLMLDVPTLNPIGDPLRLDDVASAPGTGTGAVTAGSRDGRQLVAGLGDFGQISIWDVTSRPTPVGSIEATASAIWFTPDGELVVGFVDGPVQLWDPMTVEPLGDPLPSEAAAWGFDLSDDGVLVVSGIVSTGGTRLWDVATGRALSGYLPAFGTAIAPDGSELYLGALGDGEHGATVSALSMEVGRLIGDACRRAGRNLTPEEWSSYMPEGEPYRPTCEAWPVPGA